MAITAQAIAGWVDTGKNLFALLRDLVLFLLLALLAGCPSVIGSRLTDAGLTEVDALGVKWKAQVEQSQRQTLAASAAVEQTQDKIDKVLTNLDKEIAKRPDLAPALEQLQREARQSAQTLSGAQSQLLDAASAQQTALAKANVPGTLRGWIYLGSLTREKSGWQSAKTDAPWPIALPATATITDATYIREEGAPLERRLAPPLGVAQVGSRITIESIDATVPLKAGGWTVWAKVSVKP